MRLMFVHHVKEDRGSAQDLHHFTQSARALGHEVALYGPPNPKSVVMVTIPGFMLLPLLGALDQFEG